MKFSNIFFTIVSISVAAAGPTRDLAVRLASSQLARQFPPLGACDSGGPCWNYEHAVFTRALFLLSPSPSTPFHDAARNGTTRLFTPAGTLLNWDGMQEFALDHIRVGCSILTLYTTAPLQRYRTAAGQLRQQLRLQPHTTEGGWLHKGNFVGQMWLDGAYMAVPFMAQYTALFDSSNASAWDEAGRQLRLPWQHLRINTTGLLLHGFDETRTQAWANPVTGASPEVWSRALGWYFMALVDTLDHIPRTRAHAARRLEIKNYIRQLARAVMDAVDRDTGVWWIVMSRPGRAGNWRESSGSVMFVYSLLKAVRMGYVPDGMREEVYSVSRRAWAFIIRNWIQEEQGGAVSFLNTVQGLGLNEGGSGFYGFYINKRPLKNDLRGIGPFIYAALEMDRLQS